MRVIIVLWRSGRCPRGSTLEGPLINEVTPRCLRILPCQRNGIQLKKNSQQILLFRTSGRGRGRPATTAPRHLLQPYAVRTACSWQRRGTIVYRAVGVAIALCAVNCVFRKGVLKTPNVLLRWACIIVCPAAFEYCRRKGKGKGKVSLEQATKAQRGNRGLSLLFLSPRL